MNKPKGAWERSLEWVIEQDFKEKSRIIKDHLDNPGKYPELEAMSGKEFGEFIFGDLDNFGKKLKRALDGP